MIYFPPMLDKIGLRARGDLAGGTDEEILEWCDVAMPVLERLKQEHGVSERSELAATAQRIDFDEGRIQ
jgi:hypothetical protein